MVHVDTERVATCPAPARRPGTVYFAVASADGCGPRAPPRAAAAKTQVTAEGARGADTALTLHGAIGCTLEHDLHLFFKRAKPDELLFGAPAACNERIADGLALITREGT